MDFTRIDFEQQILKCWGLFDQLNTIAEGVMDYGWTADQVSNVVYGLKEVASLEMDKLFRMFEQGIKEGKII